MYTVWVLNGYVLLENWAKAKFCYLIWEDSFSFSWNGVKAESLILKQSLEQIYGKETSFQNVYKCLRTCQKRGFDRASSARGLGKVLNIQYCYFPRLSFNKTSTMIGWFLVTCPLSNSNVSWPGYNCVVVARAPNKTARDQCMTNLRMV